MLTTNCREMLDLLVPVVRIPPSIGSSAGAWSRVLTPDTIWRGM